MKLISFVILILSVLSDFDPKTRLYEDCARTIFTDKDGAKQQNYVDASSVDDCKNRKILDYVDDYYNSYNSYTEKYNDYYKVKRPATHCCYYTYDGFGDTHKNKNSENYPVVERKGGCTELTDAYYEHISDYLKVQKNIDEKFSFNYKLDCHSKFLNIGFLLLILLNLY
jgi:hypothetical protein